MRLIYLATILLLIFVTSCNTVESGNFSATDKDDKNKIDVIQPAKTDEDEENPLVEFMSISVPTIKGRIVGIGVGSGEIGADASKKAKKLYQFSRY